MTSNLQCRLAPQRKETFCLEIKLYMNVYSNCPKLETAQISSTNEWLKISDPLYPGIPLSDKKGLLIYATT